jgi:hypothetical protein
MPSATSTAICRNVKATHGAAIGFEREDWAAFRNLDGLQRRAGTRLEKLPAVIVKELVDNALDAAGDCELHLWEGVLVVQDAGGGIEGDDLAIARLFSMNRRQISTKYLRMPTRGALGNGLRVVVGAVATTGGKLFVSTRGRTLEVIPNLTTGSSEVVRICDYDGPGTRIEVIRGSPLTPDDDDLWMGEDAIITARATKRPYSGKTSAQWYDLEAFHELLLSTQEGTTVRKFVSSFDGCSRRAAELPDRYSCKPAKSLSKPEAEALLRSMKDAVEPVNPTRLGHTSEGAFPGEYARVASQVMLSRTGGGRLNLPVVVEAWADTDPENEDSDATFMVNGSPCVADAFATHEGKEKTTRVYGCGLNLRIKTGPVKVVFRVNVITPYMPITSDGKAPHLGIFRTVIQPAME